MQIGKSPIVISPLGHQGHADGQIGLHPPRRLRQCFREVENVPPPDLREPDYVEVPLPERPEDRLLVRGIPVKSLLHQPVDKPEIDPRGRVTLPVLFAPAEGQVIVADVVEMHPVHRVLPEHGGDQGLHIRDIPPVPHTHDPAVPPVPVVAEAGGGIFIFIPFVRGRGEPRVQADPPLVCRAEGFSQKIPPLSHGMGGGKGSCPRQTFREEKHVRHAHPPAVVEDRFRLPSLHALGPHPYAGHFLNLRPVRSVFILYSFYNAVFMGFDRSP